MTDDEIRVQIAALLTAHDDALAALRYARVRMDKAAQHYDAALGSALAASRAAVELLDRIIRDSRYGDSPP